MDDWISAIVQVLEQASPRLPAQVPAWRNLRELSSIGSRGSALRYGSPHWALHVGGCSTLAPATFYRSSSSATAKAWSVESCRGRTFLPAALLATLRWLLNA
ncbi:hypothetical protein MTO96_013682 [Rhipicephalus appendiculatus]